jgi:acetyl esterase/lipase
VEDVEITTRDGKSVPARLYRPKAGGPDKQYPVYMFFHGGGFLFGSLTGEDVTCSTIADALQILVVNVCYRHTPQVRYPTPFHDAWDSFEWVARHIDDFGGDSSKITVGGISAGGGLAAYLTLEENKRSRTGGAGGGRIKGQMLGAPWLLAPKLAPIDLLASKEVSSYHQCRDAPVLPASSMALFQALLRQETPTDDYIRVSKENEEAFKGMPKTAILVAGMDPLRDEALLYGQTLEGRGYVDLLPPIWSSVPMACLMRATIYSVISFGLLTFC